MENYLLVLLLSVFVLLFALYVNTVQQRMKEMRDLIQQHGDEIKKEKEVYSYNVERRMQEMRELIQQHGDEIKKEKEVNSYNVRRMQEMHDLNENGLMNYVLELKSDILIMEKKKMEKMEMTMMNMTLTSVREELDVTRKELKQVKVESESTRNELRQAQVALNSTRVPINVIAKDNIRREDIDHIRADASRDELNVIIKENSGETYIRWGKTSCPEEAYLVYDGYAAGKHYNKGGSGANLLCLPKNPEWKEYTEGDDPTWTGKLFGVEYEIGENKPYSKTFLNQDMPCAVCQSKRSTVLMVPGKVTCHDGWHKEFSGYLMSQTSRNSRSPTEYICADEKLESVSGGDADRNEAVLYPVEAICGSLKCPPYVNGRELTCVVCSK